MYESAVDNGLSATALLHLVRLLRAIPPNLAYPNSKRRTPWRLTPTQRHELIHWLIGDGVQPSAIAAGLGVSEATVRRMQRERAKEHEASIQEVLDRALAQVDTAADIEWEPPIEVMAGNWIRELASRLRVDQLEAFLVGVVRTLVRLLREGR